MTSNVTAFNITNEQKVSTQPILLNEKNFIQTLMTIKGDENTKDLIETWGNYMKQMTPEKFEQHQYLGKAVYYMLAHLYARRFVL